MHGMLLAESAVLLCFHTVRMSFLVLSHVVVALFAFCTCQCNFCAHDFHLHLYYRSSHLPLRYLFLSIKKRPKLFHSPNYYIIWVRIRQSFFAKNYCFIKFFKYTTKVKKLQAGKPAFLINNERSRFFDSLRLVSALLSPAVFSSCRSTVSFSGFAGFQR